jgi:hypothetical protein
MEISLTAGLVVSFYVQESRKEFCGHSLQFRDRNLAGSAAGRVKCGSKTIAKKSNAGWRCRVLKIRTLANETNGSVLMEQRMQRMEKALVALLLICSVLAIALCSVSRNNAPNRVLAAESATVLHLRGLVIEDDQGRARILLGSPFPVVADRVRHDATTTAMVFLDEEGHDRFSVGEKFTPQIDGVVPRDYQELSTGFGLTLNDQLGNDRGGMGFLSNGTSVSRAVFSLDRPKGDAIGAIVDDTTGYAGLVAMYPPRQVGVEATGILLGTQGDKAYLSLQDSRNMPSTSLSVGPEPNPSLQVFDRKGKPGPNLLRSPASDRTITETQ